MQQRAGDRRFATIVQLLVDEKGNELVRFAYSTDGTARRGPVTLRGRDLERFRAALAEHPAMPKTASGWLAGARHRAGSSSSMHERRRASAPSPDRAGNTHILGVRHQPEDVPHRGVDDACDVEFPSRSGSSPARSGRRSVRSSRWGRGSVGLAGSSPCFTGITASCPGSHLEVRRAYRCARPGRARPRQTNSSDALGRSTPGRRPASHRI